MEHIIPSSAGGSDSLDNLAYSCNGCNAHKYIKTTAQDPVSETFVQLFNPRTQGWKEHFSWDETSTVILGNTPSGRATIEALNMNREPLIVLRKAMVLLGIHPPGDQADSGG
ncbi:MAG: HNH endonuclease [Saprospiraceae bacterium]